MPARSTRLPLVLLLAAGLAGCVTPGAPRAPSAAETQARALSAEGRHAEAAAAWRSIAATARGDAASLARLSAAEALWRAGDAGAAAAELQAASRRRLDGEDAVRHDLLSAALLAGAGRAGEALPLLPVDAGAVPLDWRRDWLGLRVDALAASGDAFGAAQAQAGQAGLLDAAARGNALRAAERRLREVPDGELLRRVAAVDGADPVLALALREARRRGLEAGRSLPSAATPDRPPPAADGYHPPRRMAVLLPLSGEFAPAGQAVRDGLLAAYYAERRARPAVVFLDTAGSADGARAARDKAVADGADLLLGPLGREEVAALASAPVGDATWVALNRAASAGADGASFALSPEEEGAAVADRLIERGLRRVVVVAESIDPAQRALAGLRERLQAAGGEVRAVASIDALGGNAATALATLAGPGAQAEALFVAARAPALRVLMPQREEAGLAALPVLGTSLVLSGADARLDRELDGLQYPELPWLLGDLVGPGDADSLARDLPSARGSAARLFAFGFDAWRVATYLEALRGGAQLRGATGELSIDAAGVVERRPAWAEFSGGVGRRAGDGALVPTTLPPAAPGGGTGD